MNIPPSDDDLDSSPVSVRSMTRWENPTDKDVVLNLYVGVDQVAHAAPRDGASGFDRLRARLRLEGLSSEQIERRVHDERSGTRRIVIKAGQTRALPIEFDRAIQDVRNGQVVGGLGPQLVNLDAQGRAEVHPAIEGRAVAPVIVTTTASDDRLVARAQAARAARKSGGGQ